MRKINNNIDEVYGLTPMQNGMLYHKMLNEDSTEYVLQDEYTFNGEISEQNFSKCIELIIYKYEAFRTVFMYRKAVTPKQIVLKERKSEIKIIDLSNKDEQAALNEIEKIKEEDIKRGFDLEKDILFRAMLIKLNENKSRIIFTSHHIIMDGWCNSILCKTFIDIYKELKENVSIENLKERIDEEKRNISKYSEYVKWVESKDNEAGLEYFSKLLEEYNESVTIKASDNIWLCDKKVDIEEKKLDSIVLDKIKKLAAKNNVTPNIIFETLWGILLQKYTHTQDVVFGKVVSGRNADILGIEQMMGLFINTIPVRIKNEENDTITEMIKREYQQSLESAEHDYCSLIDIQKNTELKNNLFETLFVFENYYIEKDLLDGNTDVDMKWKFSREETNYPITFSVFISENIDISIMYDTRKYGKKDILGILNKYEQLVCSLLDDSEQLVSNINIIDSKDKEIILNEFNNTYISYGEKTIMDLFYEKLKETPEKTAIIFLEKSITYKEFNDNTNSLANKLRKLGVKQNDFVAIISNRNIQMMEGIYSVIKSGAAYVPIDPNYPKERIDYILNDCKPKVILTYEKVLDTTITIIDMSNDDIWKEDIQNVKNINTRDDYAYCIYTSGTTGKPKGVINKHAGLYNVIMWMKEKYPLTKEDVILQKTTCVFDVSVSEIFGWCVNGATLSVLKDGGEKDVNEIVECIYKDKVSVIDFVPSMLSAFIMNIENITNGIKKIETLKYVIAAGEALNEQLANKFYKILGENSSVRLINLYGPTEASIYSTYYECEKNNKNIPIGKPIGNAKIYIMNKEKLCPIGVLGELCIAGEGLALGYLNKDELNEEKFIENPFGKGKMYRSGDLAKWRFDGNIEYFGRIDEQVKIRGFRIELGEIESAIRTYNKISEVAVISKKDKIGDKAIYAYYVAKENIEEKEILQYLNDKLPSYMIPTYICQIESIPVTINGKLNKRALPDIDAVSRFEYVAPKTQKEIVLCDILEKILSSNKIGIKDSFIELGGDSIKAIRVVSKLRDKGYSLKVKDIMYNSTVELIANCIKKDNNNDYMQTEVNGMVINTPIIDEFERWKLKKPEHFNQAMMLRVRGIDKNDIKIILEAIVKHHDILRAVYNDGLNIISSKESKIFDLYEYNFKYEDDYKNKIEEKCNEIQKSIDLKSGPLVKAGLFLCNENDYLMLCIHHLVVDNVSWRIIIEDFQVALEQIKNKKSIEFSKKTESYINWANSLKEYKLSEKFESENKYWQETLYEMKKIEPLCTQNYDDNGYGNIEISLEEECTQKLLKEVNKTFNTNINDLLLSSLSIAIKNVFGIDKSIVSLEGHGREEIHKKIDIDRTVGWFTCMYPVMLNYEDNIEDIIIETKEYIRKIPNHGLGYGLLDYENNKVNTNIYFNYLGEMTEQNGELIDYSLSTGMESSIENCTKGKIFINISVQINKLLITFTYDTSSYKKEIIDAFSVKYKDALYKVCECCKEQSKSKKTVSDYSALNLLSSDLKIIDEIYTKDNCIVEDIYSLTPLQEGMFFHNSIEEDKQSYIIQNTMDISSMLNIEYFEHTLEILENKYEVLRTSIIDKGIKKARQVIIKNRKIEYEVINIILNSKDNEDEIIEDILKKDVKRGFDLKNDSLLRIKYIIIDSNRAKLIWTFHHIIVDGWCTAILYSDFVRFYSLLYKNVSYKECLDTALKEKINMAKYSNYVSYIEQHDQKDDLKYWKNLLENYDEVVNIMPMNKNKNVKNDIAKRGKKISKIVTNKLKCFAQNNSVTINSVLETVWGIVLQKYNYVEDVVFGKVISGRNVPLQGIEDIVGLFINTIPVRVETTNNMTAGELVNNIYKQSIESSSYGYCSLADIQSFTQQGRELIKTLFVFENYYSHDANDKKDDSAINIKVNSTHEQTNYDLLVSSCIENDELDFELLYNPNIYEQGEIDLVLVRIEKILEEILSDAEQKVSELDSITKQEKIQIIEEFNNNYSEYDDESVVTLLEKNCKIYEDKIALCYEEESVTYKQLNDLSNKLALKLKKIGVKKGDFVAIIAQKSIEAVIGMYAIIKTGAAYVPIDSKYPKERKEQILKDCEPKAILIYGYDIELNEDITVIDLANKTIFDENLVEDEKVCIDSNDIMYVIYTSGSTGTPKGAMIEHKSVVNLVYNLHDVKLSEDTVMLQTGSLAFDASVFEIWGCLLNAGTLRMIQSDILLDMKKLKSIIIEKNINTMFLTTALFNNIVKCDETMFDSLKYVIFGGEKASDECVQTIMKRKLGLNLVNGYGPTETTVFATSYAIDNRYNFVTIGKPLKNTQNYIVRNGKLCGICNVGELCIAGAGVARGYLKRPELTCKKFVENPYGEGKLYHTGDLVRWLMDGSIEYIGRMDEQVKIRGFRIELSEIENHIRDFKAIKDTVVTVKNMYAENTICAYIVSDEVISIEKLKNELLKVMPDYMIPAYIMQIDEIPINENGKVAKKLLPVIETKRVVEYEKPTNETEKIVCEIFKEILHIKDVDINDNFFEIGGHSLRATRLINYIEERVGVKLPLKKIFKYSTVKKIAKLILEESENRYSGIVKAEEKEYYDMSSAQKRLFLINQIDKESTAYNIQLSLKIDGDIETDKFKDCIENIVKRHEILRTGFFMIDGKPVQKIFENTKIGYKYISYSDKSDEELMENIVKPFNLEEAPLYRIMLVKREGYYLFLIDVHHIICDGMSLGNFLNELEDLYNGIELKGRVYQYKDYSEWKKEEDITAQKKFWIDVFNDDIPVLDIPVDYVRPKKQSYNGTMIGEIIDKDLADKIDEISNETGATQYMIFLSAAMILLSKYSRQKDIIIGSPVSARTAADMEKMLGMFVNTIAMRGKLEENLSFRQFLEQIKEYCLKAYERQDYPFEELLENIDIVRDLSRNPLFDVMLVLQNNEQKEYKLGASHVKYINQNTSVAKFDLTFNISKEEDSYEIMLEYCTDLFKEETIKRMLKHYFNILKSITSNENITLEQIELTNQEEKKKIIEQFNNTATDYEKNISVVDMLDIQCKENPDKIALVFEDICLSYAELEKKSNYLSDVLKRYGVKKGDFVAIISEKSLETIIAVCGIIKSGAIYVPIDTKYPIDRINFILQDCKPKVLLTCDFELETDITNIDLKNDKSLWLNYNNNLYVNDNEEIVKVKPDDLIYSIYTSGTTGKPKGVLVEHRNVVKLVRNVNYIELNKDIKLVQTGAIAFDASTFEIWGCLLNGGTLHLMKEENLLDACFLKTYIKQENINTMFLTTSLFNQMAKNEPDMFDTLSNLMFGGEKASEDVVNILKSRNNKLDLVNLYGPTETTTFATYFKIKNNNEKVYIGKPVSNTQVYIMNKMNMCGIGEKGELCIAGDGVAQEYLNRQELTEEKFIKNPFGEGKLYRSGDLARWLEDGNIEFLGRLDEQVKIRGFRIELSEIESHIRQKLNVKDVAVITRDENLTKELHAYLVSDEKLDLNQVRSTLAKELPEYMVPGYIMQLEKLPLNNSNKLDKRSLPIIKKKSTRAFEEATNNIEENLCRIFSDVLGIEKIGIKDSFFELGGDSIKAIRIVSKMREVGYEITVKDIMSKFTVEGIAYVAKKVDNNNYSQEEVTGRVKNIPIIESFTKWNLEKEEHFNQAVMIKVDVSEEKIIRKVFDKIVKHHDALRAVYKNKELNILSYEESKKYDFYYYDFTDNDDPSKDIEDICTNIQKSINLENGPLMKIGMFITERGNYIMIAIHHLVVDGVSWRIILDDVNKLIDKAVLGEKLILPEKTASVIEWSKSLEEYKHNSIFEKDKIYWDKVISKLDTTLVLSDIKGQNAENRLYKNIEFVVSEELINKLLYQCSSAFNTEINDLLICALVTSIKRIFEKSDVIIGLEGHGREELHKKIDIDRTVGWFTNIYPAIIECEDTMFNNIIITKESLRKIPNHGLGYGLINSDLLKADVYFNYLGEIDGEENGLDEESYSVGKSVADENSMLGELNFNGNISSGKLNFVVTYNKGMYKKDEIDRLIVEFKDTLSEIVNCCLNVDSEITTISDCTQEDIDEDDIDIINSIISL